MKLKKLMAAMTAAVFIFAGIPSALALSADTDPVQVAVEDFAVKLATDLATTKLAGQQAQNAVVVQNDQAALTDPVCQEMESTAVEVAKAYVTAHKPYDPAKIISDTTCFSVIAMIDIPISMTGISFIDSIISGMIQQYLTGACSKATNFLGDLQDSAIQSFNSSTNGSGSMVFNYATNEPTLAQLQASAAAASTAVVTGAAASQGITLPTSVGSDLEAAQFPVRLAARQQGCSWGVPDPELCPACYDNPYHTQCLAPIPYCNAQTWPGLVPPKCTSLYNGGGSYDGGG